MSSTIGLDAARAGMELAAPVAQGATVLLPAGTTLNDAHLASLRRRGVEQLEIVPQADPALTEAERARRAARLDRLFRRSPEGGPVPRLKAMVLAYRMR